MRHIDPDLDRVLTAKGVPDEGKQMLVNFLVDQAAVAKSEVEGLRANAAERLQQAEELQPRATALAEMLNNLTVEIEE